MEKMKKKLILISGPSGSGKTTLRKMIEKEFKKIEFSVSYTSRPKRNDEIDGKDYFFISKNKFEEMIKNNEFIEWANVYGQYKGTAKKYVDKILNKGKIVLLELDIQGGEKVISFYKDICSIFILPPDFNTMKKRLIKRGGEKNFDLEKRLKNAEKEILKKDKYKYWVVNDSLDSAFLIIKNIISHYL